MTAHTKRKGSGKQMKEKIGQVFVLAKENTPVPGCTISKQISDDPAITCFSLAAHTDISAEIYDYHKLIWVFDGKPEVYFENNICVCETGSCVLTPLGIPVGVRTQADAVYLEIFIKRTDKMNANIHAGEVFKLSELIPYGDGKIVNMDLIHNEKMKFVLMAFDAGTGLSEHAAPGEAMVFALDGEGIIGYEGKEHTLHAGETFCFAKGGKHFVKAAGRFKMALLLALE